MKVAVVGSRNLTINNLGDYLPKDTTEIVSGGGFVFAGRGGGNRRDHSR